MEGKELLKSCISNTKKAIISYDKKEIMIDDINLYELLINLIDDVDTFANISDEIINTVIKDSSEKKAYKKDLIHARDLLLGKRDYNLKVDLQNKHLNRIDNFQKDICAYLEKHVPGIIENENTKLKIKTLEDALNLHRLIIDFEFVEEIVKKYDKINFDENMLSIMSYINIHNLDVMKAKRKNAPTFDIQLIKKPKLDDKVIEILKKLDINIDELPNYLLSELKKIDPKKLYNTFSVMKKNKAENGGILHLIPKNNKLCKLIILLYSSDKAILNIIDALKPADQVLSVPTLKILLNQIPSVFIQKNNEYFKPKYDNFRKNLSLLKENGVNYPALINKEPLFFLMENSIMEYTLGYLKKEGAIVKTIINKCYKVLANDPSLLIENVNVLKKYNIDIKEFFGQNNKNYSLLKEKNLDFTLNKIVTKEDLSVVNDLELLNKLLIEMKIKGE